MIEFFSSWAQQIIVAVVIGSLIEMILPDNKNKKYIKMVVGIYVLFSIISPVVNNKGIFELKEFNSQSIANVQTKNKELNQTSMDVRLQELYIEELENDVSNKAKEQGFQVHSCKVDAVITGNKENNGINKITLKVSKDNGNTKKEENSNIKNVDRVEIKVGLNKFFEEEEDKSAEKNKAASELENALCDYYGLDKKQIQVMFLGTG